ncbi:hypothetical protein [Ktedonobacter sp. SOSP1-52]|uniref:hypothetical protein n=1 Tax=Ktedonobacter sp. SOSP1-52 TaxID=2778366 RepID=UPI0019161117|nr:hypothetical protein [Ktedonobacter sp. SOSP1-52]
MRRFMLVTELNLINGIEFDSGRVALDQCDSIGLGSVDCESHSSIESLINAYSLSPIIWFKTLDITDEQRKKAEIIRGQWVTNGYKYESREVEL